MMSSPAPAAGFNQESSSRKRTWLSSAVCRQQRRGLAVRRAGVDTDVDQLGVSDLQYLIAALGLHGHIHGDRGSAQADAAGQEPDHVADQDRLMELDAIDGHGDQDREWPPAQGHLTPSTD